MMDLVGTAIGAIPDGPQPGGRVPGRARATWSWRCPAPACTATASRWPAEALRPALRATGSADALLAPTRVYVRAVEALWDAGVAPRGLAHISGGGLLNVTRLAADVSYVLDALPPAPEIFGQIAAAGDVPAATMYATFNMGTGFCVVVAPAEADAALAALRGAGEEPVVAGSVTGRPGKYVTIPAAGLTGRGDRPSHRRLRRYRSRSWTSVAMSRRTRANSSMT